jgi:HSP20 family protein
MVHHLRTVSFVPSPGPGDTGVLEEDSMLQCSRGFAPPTDVSETPEAYRVRLEIAGADPKQVDITVSPDRRTVTISGRRLVTEHTGPNRLLNLEIQCGAFARRVMLPADVDGDAATAGYVDGFLLIVLPKLRGTGQRRRVPISGPG